MAIEREPLEYSWRSVRQPDASRMRDKQLQEICCSAVGGQILQADRTVVEDGNATSSTNGGSLWCALPEKGTYNTHYNTQPALVDSWAQCYNSSVASANNPGIYEKDTKPTSDVWQCELTGNFSGSNGFAYPSYASAPASGSGPQLGRFSLLAIAGVVSIASLAATSLGTLLSEQWRFRN